MQNNFILFLLIICKLTTLFTGINTTIITPLSLPSSSNNNIQPIINAKDIVHPIDSNITTANQHHFRIRRGVINAGGKQQSIKLIDEPTCPEIKSLCSNLRSGSDDLYVLECIQTFLSSQIEALADDCQHTIWSHTLNLMDDSNVNRMIETNCAKDFQRITCKITKQPGQYLACALDHKEEIKNPSCRAQIQRLEWVAFSDFRFIGTFVRVCEKDIAKHSCGRLNTDQNRLSQGETLACLQNHIEILAVECKKGILHLSELQSDNVQLDRQLFLSCMNDVQQFCANMPAGSGAIYKCLLQNKLDPTMSHKCSDQLLRREKLIVNDYRVNKGLVRACKEDIKTNRCRRGVSEDKDIRLAQILLCLEGAHKNNTKISAECLAEMTVHRKYLMEDFQLSPEIITGCSDEIEKFCSDLDSGGKTIHCLMEHARPKKKKDLRVSAQCQRALEMLVKVSDVGEDWRVDPVLHSACVGVVNRACHDTVGGDARVMSCLMEKIGTNYMVPECESALMQIQYFIARDFKLDPQLYRNCKEDAVRLCQAKKTWADIDNQMDPERGPLVFPCLHRNAYHPNENGKKSNVLKPECVHEIKRVMRQRAMSVDLIPEVEDVCLDDLATHCFDKPEKGEEMQCLQDNMEKLEERCKDAVVKYTEDEAADIELNPIIMKYCRNAMDTFCGNILRAGGDDNGDMMECLIAHKNEPDLKQDQKCRAAIEHFQLISLKSYHFTFKFKEACRPHVMRFCPKSNTKYDIVSCLSEVMRNDTLKDQHHTIPKECRQQVKAQLFQQRENINFDPKLKKACKDEIERYCSSVSHGGGQVLECLQTNTNTLGTECRHMLFNIRRSELSDSSTDYTLINTCRDMIRQYCHDVERSKALECLKLHKSEPLFDTNCHTVIVNRMIEQNMDYRFNPALKEACNDSITMYCKSILINAKPNEELNGKVVDCLKVQFREGKLTKKCENQMLNVLQEQALNYKLNPLLQTVCKSEIQILCKPNSNDIEDNGEVEECLKMAFLKHNIQTRECQMEVAVMIQGSKADIHVDPLLQRACTVDLLKYCSNIQPGNGRQLKCLQVVLTDPTKALEDDCRRKLETRFEMYLNAAPLIAQAPENFGELYTQVASSPSHKFFMVTMLAFVGIIFIMGLFCGSVTRRTIALKNK